MTSKQLKDARKQVLEAFNECASQLRSVSKLGAMKPFGY